MKITKHAKIRSQQRWFSEEDIMLLMLFGDATEKPGNAIEYKIGKKHKDSLVSKIKQFIQRLDRITKKAALVDGDNIITVYNLR
jgi:hypothetical protein